MSEGAPPLGRHRHPAQPSSPRGLGNACVPAHLGKPAIERAGGVCSGHRGLPGCAAARREGALTCGGRRPSRRLCPGAGWHKAGSAGSELAGPCGTPETRQSGSPRRICAAPPLPCRTGRCSSRPAQQQEPALQRWGPAAQHPSSQRGSPAASRAAILRRTCWDPPPGLLKAWVPGASWLPRLCFLHSGGWGQAGVLRRWGCQGHPAGAPPLTLPPPSPQGQRGGAWTVPPLGQEALRGRGEVLACLRLGTRWPGSNPRGTFLPAGTASGMAGRCSWFLLRVGAWPGGLRTQEDLQGKPSPWPQQ